MSQILTNLIYPLYENPILYVIIQTVTGCSESSNSNQNIGAVALANSSLNILDPNTEITLLNQQYICFGETVNLQNGNNNIKIIWNDQGISVFNNNVQIVQYIRSTPPFNCSFLTQNPLLSILKGGLVAQNPSNCNVTSIPPKGINWKYVIPGLIIAIFFIIFLIIIYYFGKNK